MSSPSEEAGEISTPNVLKLSSDLRPLMFWMSNATELLNFFQVKVETMEKEWEFEGDFETARLKRVPPTRDGLTKLKSTSEAMGESVSSLVMIAFSSPRGPDSHS